MLRQESKQVSPKTRPTGPNSLLHATLDVKAGVAAAEGDGVRVKGQWAANPRVIGAKRETIRLLEDFANWPLGADAAHDVARFTRRYAPLRAPWAASALMPNMDVLTGARFGVVVGNWRVEQSLFQATWERLGRLFARQHWDSQPLKKGESRETAAARRHGWLPGVLAGGAGLELAEHAHEGNLPEQGYAASFGSAVPLALPSADGLVYRCCCLLSFLRLSLLACEPSRLRRCHNPECKTPYFVARHLKQNFCNERCAEWGQRQAKRKWWLDHGEAWLARRKRKSSRKEN